MNCLEAIHKTLVDCQVKKFPIDCFRILEHYGFKILSYTQLKEKNPELYELCLLISNDAFTDKVNHIVAFNEKVNSQRIRFSLMHELGHYILKHKGQSQKNEEEADYFASNILAPRAVMYNLSCKNADDVHATFEISYTAANRAWYDYRKRAWCEYDRCIKEHFFPPELANDMSEDPPTIQVIEGSTPEPTKKNNLSAEAEARRQRALNIIRRKHKKTQKRLKEYEDDMAFLGFSDEENFERAERQWFSGYDL